jgi:serine/threonine protein phosphatase 1
VSLASTIRQFLVRPAKALVLPRLSMTIAGPIYAVGDVHGCMDLLLDLEDQIVSDAAEGAEAGPPTVIMLGDYVDRGPDSAAVLEHLLNRPKGFSRLCLTGNHEIAMLRYLDDPKRNSGWLDFGGDQTLASYGLVPAQMAGLKGRETRQLLSSHVPLEHRRFLESLPIAIDTPDFIFVHAGLRPGIDLTDQHDRDLTLFRDKFEADYAEFGRIVVHGHTPVPTPVMMPHRVAIDTGAYYSGQLCAVALKAGSPPRVLMARTAAATSSLRTN